MSEFDNQMVLACEIPEGATPGSTFHVQLNDRYFEVITPEDAVPGQTINIVVPAEASTVQETDATESKESSPPQYPEQLQSLTSMGFSPDEVAAALASTGGDLDRATAVLVGETRVGTVVPPLTLAERFNQLAETAVAHAKNIDSKYKITDKIVEVATPAIEKLKATDEKYKVSERAIAAGETAKAKISEVDEKYEISAKTSAAIAAGVQKLREIDEKHKLSDRAIMVGDRITAYAREIDGKYAVTATIGRIVEGGIDQVVSAYQRLTTRPAAAGTVVEEVELSPPTATAVSAASPDSKEAVATVVGEAK